MQENIELATLAGGCFWCIEPIFAELRGVDQVKSGYTGGRVAHPTYEQICMGETGHAEAVQITFDPKTISFKELLRSSLHFMTRPRSTARERTSALSIARRFFIIRRNKKRRPRA